MQDKSPFMFRVADLPNRKTTRFTIAPTADERAQIADELGILGIKKLNFQGQIFPVGNRDWKLEAKLGASVVQTCVVTLDPVGTRIDSKTSRRFTADPGIPEGNEVEMPEDDSIESLGEFIDAYEVMIEALSIELPDYPRKGEAQLETSNFTEPGKTAMTDQDARPFAVLAGLKDKLGKTGEGQ